MADSFSGWSHQAMRSQMNQVAAREQEFADLEDTYTQGATRFDKFQASLNDAIGVMQSSWSSEGALAATHWAGDVAAWAGDNSTWAGESAASAGSMVSAIHSAKSQMTALGPPVNTSLAHAMSQAQTQAALPFGAVAVIAAAVADMHQATQQDNQNKAKAAKILTTLSDRGYDQFIAAPVWQPSGVGTASAIPVPVGPGGTGGPGGFTSTYQSSGSTSSGSGGGHGTGGGWVGGGGGTGGGGGGTGGGGTGGGGGGGGGGDTGGGGGGGGGDTGGGTLPPGGGGGTDTGGGGGTGTGLPGDTTGTVPEVLQPGGAATTVTPTGYLPGGVGTSGGVTLDPYGTQVLPAGVVPGTAGGGWSPGGLVAGSMLAAGGMALGGNRGGTYLGAVPGGSLPAGTALNGGSAAEGAAGRGAGYVGGSAAEGAGGRGGGSAGGRGAGSSGSGRYGNAGVMGPEVEEYHSRNKGLTAKGMEFDSAGGRSGALGESTAGRPAGETMRPGSTGGPSSGAAESGSVVRGGSSSGGSGSGVRGFRGNRDEEDEAETYTRPEYLMETDDVWGDGSRVSPSVLG